MDFLRWVREIHQSRSYLSFPIRAKLLRELHPDIACNAGNKQHIVNPNSEANICIGIHLWSSLAPVLNHTASKKESLVTLSYKDICGRNKNQFLYYFGLFYNLLHRQDLSKRWFERKLKRLATLLSIFRKDISPGWFYCVNSQGNFEVALELCGYQ